MQHDKHAHELKEDLGRLEKIEEIYASGGMALEAESSEGSYEPGSEESDELEEVRGL